MNILNWNKLSDTKRRSLLMRPVAKNTELSQQVKSILFQVKKEGDNALLELTKKYDNAKLDNILVTDNEFKNAENSVQNNILNSIETAISRIENYQRKCLQKEITVDTNDGIICRKIPTPIERVGLYVPGGTAPLISTLIMLSIPAKIAGCPTRVLCTPPNTEGKINPILLTAAKLCGIDTVCKIGGAQAIAAMAYGTESVPKVNKLYGPGNTWVTQAKQLVAQDPDGAAIDMPAGPSEVLVIADETAKPEFIASDLLSQAEHGEDSQVIFLTQSEKIAQDVVNCIESQLETLSRKEIIRKSLNNSRIILVNDLTQAFEISNQYAPEHLIVQLKNAENYIELIRNAGAVFLGEWTPESMGDYINGSNHVLPTYGYADRFSGLSVADFMKYISFQSVSKEGLQALGPMAMQLAEIEGLDAHKKAVDIRLNCLRCAND